MQRLLIGDVATVLILFLHVPARRHVSGIFSELENVRAEKADPVLDRVLQRANRGHH